MFHIPDFLDPDYYIQGGEVSTVIIESLILAFLISAGTAIGSFRIALKKQSTNFVWLGTFAAAYSIWNILYLSSYSNRDLPFPTGTLPTEMAHKAHLVIALLLPYLAHRFLWLFFGRRSMLPGILAFTLMALLTQILLFKTRFFFWALLMTGIFVFGAFMRISLGIWKFYRTTDDLKMKTRSYFLVVGLMVCSLFSVLGQLRSENIFPEFSIPYIGNILTAIFIFFIYQMAVNPRLREIRELMLRGIRVMFLTVILAAIFVALLSWVGDHNAELFIFNTFIASFIILSILEPLRKQLDSFFLKKFIVDRYEFEELLKKLPKKIRKTRNLEELTAEVVEGVRESGRIYQAGLFLWDSQSSNYRLIAPSNLTFKNTLELSYPWIPYIQKHRQYLLLEQAQDLPQEVADALNEMHSHIVLPLFKGDELLGVLALRSSLRSTNPYTSFSNDEIEQLEQLSTELVAMLDQIQHFDAQERQVKLASLGEMSAALAHEIRNPLGAIQGASQLLETSKDIHSEDDKECVQILKKEITRMQRTVDQYLNFARQNEDPISVSLRDLTLGIIKDIESKATKTNTKIHFHSADAVPEIKTDPLKLEQVLFNLIQNACEAFSKNIWVNIQLLKDLEFNRIKIEVKDDGPGIPENHLKNIFTPLFTTKRAGSGLGLPICKKIAESLGGDLTVQSTVGSGSTFAIILPLEQQKGAARGQVT